MISTKYLKHSVTAAVLVLLSLVYYLLTYRIWPGNRQINAHARPHPAFLNNTTPSSPTQSNLTTNLVVATTAKDDISWTDNLHNDIPNLTILRYVSDNSTAQFHPPVAKGREALMYFTYMHDFYDALPDVTIFVHAEELSWHVEGTLLKNTSFALSQLNLARVVEERGYFNLRVTWRAGCPAWIDTRKSYWNYKKQEEPYMSEAWRANFDDPVPDVLAGPCCSQFAVSRAAIRRRPREQYERSIKWMLQTSWGDHIVGRVWEHMWPWLFKEEVKDCAPQRESLCSMYGICFEDDSRMDDYMELWEERNRLKWQMSYLPASWAPERAAEASEKMYEVKDEIERRLGEALARGRALETKAAFLPNR